MNPNSLWEIRSRIFILGGLEVSLTTLAVMLIAMLLGVSWMIALAVGLVLARSSTAIVNQTLKQKGLLRSDGGQASLSVLLLQDIAAIPTLAGAIHRICLADIPRQRRFTFWEWRLSRNCKTIWRWPMSVWSANAA
ncbi:MAG: cation:proton antiporter [Rhizobiaceae bacterium]